MYMSCSLEHDPCLRCLRANSARDYCRQDGRQSANHINGADVVFDDGPFAVLHVSVETDMIQRVGEVDLVGRVDPCLQLHRAALVVERVENHIERARDGVDSTGLPASRAVVMNRYHESSIVVFLEQRVGAAPRPPHTYVRTFIEDKLCRRSYGNANYRPQ